MMRTRQVGGMKALRWILLWILIGVKMHMVEAVEKEIPARQEMERMLETALVPRVGNTARWRMMDSCDKGWKEGERWQKVTSKNSHGKAPGTFKRNSQDKEPSTLDDRSHQAKTWLVQKKRKEEKWRKKKKIGKEEEGEVQKKEMVEEVQRAVYVENAGR